MICKKCGFNIEKNWKYCPNCSKKIYNKQKIIIVSTIMSIVIISIIISIINNNMPVDDKYIEKQLEKKYREDFSNISLIKSVENPDTDLSCDGSYFGTIKGEGSTEYYKVYSKKNNIEFIVTYDTTDETKTIKDSYKDNLKRRKTLVNTYKTIYKYLNSKNYKVVLSGGNNLININSENQLEGVLSKYEEENIDLKDFKIYINEDLHDFCKSNYETITKLNDEIVALQKNNDYYFLTSIVLNGNATIELYRLNYKAYIYDKSGNSAAWGETLDEFVTRESY